MTSLENSPDISALAGHLGALCPQRSKSELLAALSGLISLLNRPKNLESAAPSPSSDAEKDTQNLSNSPPLSRDSTMENTQQNTENTEEDLDSAEEAEEKNAPSSLPSELIPLVSAHLKAAGLPDAFISQIHQTALGKNFREPPASQETEDAAASGKKKNSAKKTGCASDTAFEDDETRLERVFGVSRHK